MSNSNSSPEDFLRPFIDPKLVQKHERRVDESWLSDFVSPKEAPQGAYSVVSQTVKKFVPERTACRFGCGGARCKYERSDYWTREQMAIDGIFSHWITDRILACSRPTTRHVDLKTLFYNAGIRAIFNLEAPDEHVLCGHGNHQSGFSYNPTEFMDVGIFVYNYAMEDYGTVKVETILDIMKVMNYSMKQGKIAVHCHAGLGRTGFVICSYLVHEYRMTAHDAIHYIRARRPGSVQMNKQIEAVGEYERFIKPKRRVFTDCADSTEELTIEEHLKNQQAFVHGRDAFIYKSISRVVFVCAARLVSLCTGFMIDTILLTINRRKASRPIFFRKNLQNFSDEEKETWLDFAPSFFYEHEHLTHRDFLPAKQIFSSILRSINNEFLSADQQTKISTWKQKLNKTNDGVNDLFVNENDPSVIAGLMWSWLKLLKVPIISNDDFKHFTKNNVENPVEILSKLSKSQCGMIELLAKMFAFLRQFAENHQDRLLILIIINHLTQRSLIDSDELRILTVDEENLRHFLLSEHSNYLNRRQTDTIERLVSPTGLTREFIENFSEFFLNLSTQFEE